MHVRTLLGLHPVEVTLVPTSEWPEAVVQLSYRDPGSGVEADAVLRLNPNEPQGTWYLRGVSPQQPTWSWQVLWRSAAGQTARGSGEETGAALVLVPPA